MSETIPQPVEEAKQGFRRLLAEGARSEAIIEFLEPLRAKVDLDSDDAGWVLWNICDRYAMLRRADMQHPCQSDFWDWCTAHFPARLHWVVSDGTQALTLIDGGYLTTWSQWYEHANRRCPRTDENRGVRFEAHRANASAYTRFGQFQKAETALGAIREILGEDVAWPNRDFATVTLHTLQTDLHIASGAADRIGDTHAALANHLTEWLARVRMDGPTPQRPILGSWAQLNERRGPSAVFVAVNNAACSLVQARLYPASERLFRFLLEHGRTLNAYAEAHHILACWGVRHDTAEVQSLFRASTQLTADKVRRFVPELSAVLALERTGAAQPEGPGHGSQVRRT